MSDLGLLANKIAYSIQPKSDYEFNNTDRPWEIKSFDQFLELVINKYAEIHNLDKVTVKESDRILVKMRYDTYVRDVNKHNEKLQKYKDEEYQIKVARVEGIINEGRFCDKGYDTKIPHVFNKFWNLCTFKRIDYSNSMKTIIINDKWLKLNGEKIY